MAINGIPISIHALREEGDDGVSILINALAQFLSTPSARRATGENRLDLRNQVYFYPRPPRGGRLFGERLNIQGRDISIHALREEGDAGEEHGGIAGIIISIHALREEGDRQMQSSMLAASYFYPRPPRGGRRTQRRSVPVQLGISIHALREEGDLFISPRPVCSSEFLSTPSARRATRDAAAVPAVNMISIHALREEGDEERVIQGLSEWIFLSTPSARRATARHGVPTHSARYFYPRPPRGGRRGRPREIYRAAGFLSTPSARRATRRRHHYRQARRISIHALREEGDKFKYPKQPDLEISIHALREEGDLS